MTRPRTLIFGLALVLLTAGFATAQTQEEYRIGQFQGGIDFMLAFPQGQFDENVDAVGFGLNVDLGYVIPNMPVVAGFSGGFATYGSNTYKVPLLANTNLVTVDLTTSNNIAFGHLFLRFQPQSGVFRPYFEGLLGLNYLWTESTVKDERYEDKEIAGSTNLGDVAFSYGGGGGIMFRVHKGQTNEPGKGVEVFVDVKLRYLYGGEAKYFTKRSIQNISGQIILDERYADKSTTDMILGMVGVAVRL